MNSMLLVFLLLGTAAGLYVMFRHRPVVVKKKSVSPPPKAAAATPSSTEIRFGRPRHNRPAGFGRR